MSVIAERDCIPGAGHFTDAVWQRNKNPCLRAVCHSRFVGTLCGSGETFLHGRATCDGCGESTGNSHPAESKSHFNFVNTEEERFLAPWRVVNEVSC